MARSIIDFTELVTDYLIPVIRFVGHKDELFDALERIYPGLVHEREYSGAEANLVIFDKMPIRLLQPQLKLSADTAYIFALSTPDLLNDDGKKVLQNLNALTLVKPDREQLLWNVKVLLMINELSYTNGQSTFIDLMSINPDHRAEKSKLINAVLNRHSCMVTVPSDGYRDTLLQFLFDTAPKGSVPIYVDASRAQNDLFEKDRCNVVLASNDDELEAISLAIDGVSEDISILLFVTNSCSLTISSSRKMIPISLENSLDKTGIHLIAYWCAAIASHRTGKIEFFSNEYIEDIFTRCGHDPVEYRNKILSSTPQQEMPDSVLGEILETYQRLSLDSILGELERHILLRMKERCPKIEAASHSVGIPTVTFHKKNARLAKKPSLIEMFFPSKNV